MNNCFAFLYRFRQQNIFLFRKFWESMFRPAGQILMKFGTEVVLKGRKFLGGGVDPVPPTLRVQDALRGCLWSLSKGVNTVDLK